MKPSPHRVPGLRPEKFLPTGLLATRANIRKFVYDLKRSNTRTRRRVEYASYTTREQDGRIVTHFLKDKDGHRIPLRVLHETKGWQSARVAL